MRRKGAAVYDPFVPRQIEAGSPTPDLLPSVRCRIERSTASDRCRSGVQRFLQMLAARMARGVERGEDAETFGNEHEFCQRLDPDLFHDLLAVSLDGAG